MEALRAAILRTLCFHQAWGYAPTQAELFLTLDAGERTDDLGQNDFAITLRDLLAEGTIAEFQGRLGLADKVESLVQEIRARDAFQPRKRRRALHVARWLSRLGGVRLVALANTTALGNARDQGDLDFFVIARRGTLWITRLLGAGPFKLAGLLPREGKTRDAVCLSYFVADDALDLSSHMLQPDDPYFRYWFMSLLPLYDDGVGQTVWDSNPQIRARHPLAAPWIVPPDFCGQPSCQLPATSYRWLESLARVFQRRWFPSNIRELMNRDTRVIVNDRTLKFHVTDAREKFRAEYYDLCSKFQIAP